MTAELLAQTVARHFETATIAKNGTHVDLGLEGLAIDCKLGNVQTLGGDVHSVQILMTLSGGEWTTPVELAMNGYGGSTAEAITTGACAWSCTFAPVLESALSGEPVGRVKVAELELAGTTMHCYVDTFDTVLHFEPGGEQTQVARERLGASPFLAPVLLSVLEDVTAKEMMIASLYIGEIGEKYIVELRLDGQQFLFSEEMFADVARAPAQQMVSLRELAILVRA